MIKTNVICDLCKRENLSDDDLYQFTLSNYLEHPIGKRYLRLDFCKDCVKKFGESLGFDLIKMKKIEEKKE